MALFDDSLAKLEKVAASPLAKHVNKLTFYCDVLPTYSIAQWEREVDSRLGHLYHYKNDVNSEWNAYRELVQEQERWQHSEQGKAFQEAFLRLPNLAEVRAIRAVEGDVDASQWPIWKRLTKRCIVGPDQWKKHRETSVNPFMDENADARRALAALEAMGERASLRLRPITKLQLQLYCQNFYFMRPLGHQGFAQPVPPSWSSSVKPKIRTAFAYLTELSLYLETSFQWEQFGGILADFSDFLYHARQLQSLRFWFEYSEDFGGDWPEDLRLYTDQIGFFSNDIAVWPKIEHLSIKVNVPSSKLLRFLSLHSNTLRSLELRHMFVYNVPLLLEGIPKILTLDHVYIQGLWHYGPGLPQDYLDDKINVCFLGHGIDCNRVYETWMKKYLLRETARMPDINDDPLVRIKTGYGMNLLEYEPIFEDRSIQVDYSSVASEEG